MTSDRSTNGRSTRALMVQGCTSNAGKSWLAAGLCRLYANRGLKVAPFKAQNMSNNAGVTPDGLEMGRAQILQAQAARLTPDVRMNPVLVKPEGETRSQVVVLGRHDQAVSRLPWTARKAELWGSVRESLHGLMNDYELVVIEGAGSPAEVNLKDGDIVNMRVAREAGARVLLAADIDRGGAFAHLLGTWHCLEEGERALLAGFVLNKFRGDPALLGGGTSWLERETGVPTLGVVPYLPLPLPQEDAFSLESAPASERGKPVVAMLRFPYLANFDEFDALLEEGIEARWVEDVKGLVDAAAVILPGSKHVAADLGWLRETGLAAEVSRLAQRGVPILGICGGFQMLGRELCDPHGIEGGGEALGLGLLDATTELAPVKTTRQVSATLVESGARISGYEIHHGATRPGPSVSPYLSEGLGFKQGNVMGVYLHGLFENAAYREVFLGKLGVRAGPGAWTDRVDAALDTLAAHLEAHLDIDAIDRALEAGLRPARPPSSGRLVLVTGGARSGKSRYAERLARHYGGEEVAYLATLEPGDAEMQDRIAHHRARRPTAWTTLEAPLRLTEAFGRVREEVVMIDCLSGWVANLLLAREGQGAALDETLEAVAALLQAVQASGKTVIVVSNEVGCGVVPAYPLGRLYRDALGLANQQMARAATLVVQAVVGIPQVLKGEVLKGEVPRGFYEVG